MKIPFALPFRNIHLRHPDWRFLLRKLPQMLAIGLLLAVGFALFPTARCALADCGPKDQWCNGDCSQTCGATTGVNLVTGCVRHPSYCEEILVTDYTTCWCNNPDNCECTDGSGDFPYWDVRACRVSGAGCATMSNVEYITCCSGGPEECAPSYDPPAISTRDVLLIPPHPLVLGQDPDQMGVSITGVTAAGGSDTSCGSGQQTITSLTVAVRLSDTSIAWINGPLAQRYPGARVKGSYPTLPELTTTGLGTSTAVTAFHFDPLDPGTYNVTITTTQADGQITTAVLPVPVSLLDATLSTP